LYKLSCEEIRYDILDPVTGAVASLLDGSIPVSALTDAIRQIFGLAERQTAADVLAAIVAMLNRNDNKVATAARPPRVTASHNPISFIVPVEAYSFDRRLNTPISLMLYFSAECQTNCRYCYADLVHLRKSRHLPLTEWRRILEEARSLDVRMLQLTGGDPLGRSESQEFLRLLVKLGFLFTVSTKCHVQAEDAHRLVEAGFNEPVGGVQREFQISLDSIDGPVASYLSGEDDYAERAIWSLRNLIAAGITPRAKAVLTPYNVRGLREYVAKLADLGVTTFQFAGYNRSHYRHRDSLFLTEAMKREAGEMVAALVHEHPELTIRGSFLEVTGSNATTADQWANRAGCSGGRTTLGVAPDGSVLLCEQIPFCEPHVVGDLTRQSILEVWNSRKLLDYIRPTREQFITTPCFDCDEFDACIHERGYCFRDALFAYGKLRHPPPNCPHAPEGALRVS
jgi:radical SAM protein with 4Fe4S-binding SPASM domain